MPTLHQVLADAFQAVDLSTCDGPAQSLLESALFATICRGVPAWGDLVTRGRAKDHVEADRTLRHTIRTLWVYFAIRQGRFAVEGLDRAHLRYLWRQIRALEEVNPDLFPLILLFHDIGRPFNVQEHSFESARLINALPRPESLSREQFVLFRAVVKYHLLPGTILTGESSYTGATALLRDPEVEPLFQSPAAADLVRRLFTYLEIFTYVDLWGYDYARVLDHYFTYYQEIRENLVATLTPRAPDSTRAELPRVARALAKRDDENLLWRLACSLRVFQFAHTRLNLTPRFFFEKIQAGLAGLGWSPNPERPLSALFPGHARIQFKYALPMMMVLARGRFSRDPIGETEPMDARVLRWWRAICGRLEELAPDAVLWEVIFHAERLWFLDSRRVAQVRDPAFLEHILEASPTPVPARQVHQLRVAF